MLCAMGERPLRETEAKTQQHRLMSETTQGKNGHGLSTATSPAQFAEIPSQERRTATALLRYRPVARRQTAHGIGDPTTLKSRRAPRPAGSGEAMTQERLMQPSSGIIAPEWISRAMSAQPPGRQSHDQQSGPRRAHGRYRRCMPVRVRLAIGVTLQQQPWTGTTMRIEATSARSIRQFDQAVSPRTRWGSSMPWRMASSVSSTSLEILNLSKMR